MFDTLPWFALGSLYLPEKFTVCRMLATGMFEKRFRSFVIIMKLTERRGIFSLKTEDVYSEKVVKLLY